jgi:transcriptional regulator with XRE-family HTH domain
MGSEADFDQFVGSRLRELRIARGLTQDQVARPLGLARTSVTNIEAGRQPASGWLLWRIAQLLSTEVAALLPESPDPLPPEAVLPNDLTPKSRDVINRLSGQG